MLNAQRKNLHVKVAAGVLALNYLVMEEITAATAVMKTRRCVVSGKYVSLVLLLKESSHQKKANILNMRLIK